MSHLKKYNIAVYVFKLIDVLVPQNDKFYYTLNFHGQLEHILYRLMSPNPKVSPVRQLRSENSACMKFLYLRKKYVN